MSEVTMERQVRIIRISADKILNLLRHQPEYEYINRLEFDLPEDAKILNVQYNELTLSFDFKISSTSFELVPEHKQIPLLHLYNQVVKMPIKEKL